MRIFQFRRYELEPEGFDEFVAWAIDVIIPLRENMGYRVEWKYVDPVKSEFLWLVSAQATEAEFELMDQAWMSSPERAEAVLSMPRALIRANVSFVTPS
jgi:hypothetical protein